jgi:hypothetical protein
MSFVDLHNPPLKLFLIQEVTATVLPRFACVLSKPAIMKLFAFADILRLQSTRVNGSRYREAVYWENKFLKALVMEQLCRLPEQRSLPPPSRGVIIVDTGSLLHLAVKLPLKEGKRTEKSLLDVLSFLARSGFQVIVPEMVAFEAGDVLHTTDCTRIYFPESKIKPMMAPITAFLRDNALSGLVTIAPPPEADTSPPAEFIRLIGRIHESNKSEEQKKSAIIAARRDFAPLRDFGDIAAQQLVRYMDDKKAPVFYFSEDAKALNAVLAPRPDLSVHKLPLRCFLEALEDFDILPSINFEQKTTGSVISAIKKNFDALGRTRIILRSPEHVNDTNRRAFSKALAGIVDAKAKALPGRHHPPKVIEAFTRHHG